MEVVLLFQPLCEEMYLMAFPEKAPSTQSGGMFQKPTIIKCF